MLGPARLRRDRAPPLDGIGLLANGGASRGNLLSGEADHVILTVSKLEAEKARTPATGPSSRTASTSRARSSSSSGMILEITASARQRRRDVGRAATAAASTRSCAPRCASSSAT